MSRPTSKGWARSSRPSSTRRRRCPHRWRSSGGRSTADRDIQSLVFTRRGFVKLVGTGAVLAACGDNIRLTRGVFLDERGYETIDIATGIIFPGARDAQAVRYIDTLLAAFEVAPPAIFASGPYSGRTAF